jgi:hypothetical protein
MLFSSADPQVQVGSRWPAGHRPFREIQKKSGASSALDRVTTATPVTAACLNAPNDRTGRTRGLAKDAHLGHSWGLVLGRSSGLISPAPAVQGSIKGAAFREFLVFYARTVDAKLAREAVRDAQFPSLSPAASDFGVVQSTWYPAELVHGLLDRLTDGMPEREQAALAQAAANHVMSVTLRGVYKTLFSLLATPDRYARHIPKLWRVHYDNGEPVILIRGSGDHLVSFVEWWSHHPFICRLNMAAALPIYTAMGCRDVAWRRTHCKSSGGEHCTTVVTWRGD